MTIAFISHPDCALHDMGAGHPEQPARLAAIKDQMIASGLDGIVEPYDAPLATREQLLRAHDARYVDSIFKASPARGILPLDADTAMNPHTLTAALRAAGGAIHAVDLVLGENAVNQAFCSVRPPGHHAERDRAMGFCFFNNIAVATLHALEQHRLKRVAIVDFDVHHGNGTEDILREEPRVLFCSSFQHPLYPGSGAHTVSDHIINIPLPAGTSGADYRQVVAERWFDALDEAKPQLIFFSAGFDAHVEDPLAQLRLTEDDYFWLTSEIMRIAKRHCGGRVVSSLEGGYNLSALGRSVVSHIKAMMS